MSVPELCSMERLSRLVNVPVSDLIARAEPLGEHIESSTAPLSRELLELLGLEYDVTVQVMPVDAQRRPAPTEEEASQLPLRPPIVTLMGHVDHGKTSLLDAFRGSAVAAGEAGGITQAISVFTVEPGTERAITFIDTPGHELFASMRQRGATATDIIVLVVAVNAGVQPTTVQAIEFARETGAPLVVAANKIDREGGLKGVELIGRQLLEHGVIAEEFGGDVPLVGVSARRGTNLDALRDAILLQAELMELHAESEGDAEGLVLEAAVAKGLGSVATVLVQRGELRPGDHVVAGTAWGKVRVMQDERGGRLNAAGPSTPVRISGLKGTPAAGDELLVLPSEARAREVSEFRLVKQALEAAGEAEAGEAAAEVTIVPAVVKADSHGSLEAVLEGVGHFPTDRVALKVIKTGIGPLSDADVQLASTVGAAVVGLNMPVPSKVAALAEQSAVPVYSRKVIYDLVDVVKDVLEDAIPPVLEEEVLGTAEVLQRFTLTLNRKDRKAGMSKFTSVAGARVATGEASASARVKVLRGEDVLHDGSVVSIRHFKQEVKSVRKGAEFGLVLADYSDYEPGDIISFYEIVSRKPGLYDAAPAPETGGSEVEQEGESGR